MTAAEYIAREADEREATRNNTPKATALWSRTMDALDATRDDRKRLELEALAGALAIHKSYSEDLTDEGAEKYEARLEKLIGGAR